MKDYSEALDILVDRDNNPKFDYLRRTAAKDILDLIDKFKTISKIVNLPCDQDKTNINLIKDIINEN